MFKNIFSFNGECDSSLIKRTKMTLKRKNDISLLYYRKLVDEDDLQITKIMVSIALLK
jgi:hypothetical protein